MTTRAPAVLIMQSECVGGWHWVTKKMWVDRTPDLVLRRMIIVTIIIIIKNDNEREFSRDGLEVVNAACGCERCVLQIDLRLCQQSDV